MLFARFSRLGRAVFNEEAFQVIMCVWWHVVRVFCALVRGILCTGGEYYGIGVLLFSALVRSLIGRNRNLSINVCKLMCSFCWTNLYSSLCIVLGRLMMLEFVFMNWVYGCGVSICLSSGFRRVAILSSRDVVQSGFAICMS